ncbi:MAG: 2-C-methyl-D-erythritol 4-phosphate cytidylyltransferase [Clostridia bacterium]|nr:2-C-methyl-D-erythritol 4-phosphate cytidylyltransferase [Clostridia bacterium]
MNIAMIMSGGIGKRFGAPIPKQYTKLKGRPVIDYVIETCKKSKKTDKILIVIDKQCMKYSDMLSDPELDFAPNGRERLESVKNGFDYIKSHYDCAKVVILDAVAPFVYPELIDDYFDKLGEYDAVITAQKITGALGNVNFDPLDREQFYVTQSPEGFIFDKINAVIDTQFPSQELAWQLPRSTKKYLNFDFKNNLKLTYDFELQYAEFYMDYLASKNLGSSARIIDSSRFVTEGLRYFLLRLRPEETQRWIDNVAAEYNRLSEKWGLGSFIPSQSSRYGLVLFAKSEKYGDCVVKFIPDFVGRYQTEVDSYRELSKGYMCELIDTDDRAGAMLLKRISPAKYADFNDNIRLTEFFDTVDKTIRSVKTVEKPERFLDFFDDLKAKLAHLDEAPFCRAEIGEHLQHSIELYERYFSDAPLYLCHGDLHAYNVLLGEDHYSAVDPIGVIAPRELEFVRFMRNDILNIRSFGMRERLDLLLSYFSRWTGRKSLLLFLYIDTVYVTYNCTFEHPTDEQTRYNLKLIKVIRKMIEQNMME